MHQAQTRFILCVVLQLLAVQICAATQSQNQPESFHFEKMFVLTQHGSKRTQENNRNSPAEVESFRRNNINLNSNIRKSAGVQQFPSTVASRNFEDSEPRNNATAQIHSRTRSSVLKTVHQKVRLNNMASHNVANGIVFDNSTLLDLNARDSEDLRVGTDSSDDTILRYDNPSVRGSRRGACPAGMYTDTGCLGLLVALLLLMLCPSGGWRVSCLVGGRGGSRQDRGLLLLCLVWHASQPTGAGAATVVAYKGYEYRTLDGTAPTVTSAGWQSEYIALPAGGWALAPDNADAVAVTAAYHWGTYCLFFASGGSIFTAMSSSPGSSCTSRSGFSQSGNQYKVIGYQRILISRPCAAGGYHGSTRTTYEEAATATCTPCAAGQYSAASGAAGSGCPMKSPVS